MLPSDRTKSTEADCVPKLDLLSVRNILIILTIEVMSHRSVTTKGKSVTMALPKWHQIAAFAGMWTICQNDNNAYGTIKGFVLFFCWER